MDDPKQSLSDSHPSTSEGGDVEVVDAQLAPEPADLPPRQQVRRGRNVRLPVILFLLTCVSTFVVGATQFMPLPYLNPFGDGVALRHKLMHYWPNGLTYMFCILAILLTHEMGHFIATLVHRIRASLPLFLPFPFNPLGTLGAVIVMDAMKADRRQMFDIGIAGPLAGLVIAVPVMWYGVATLDMTEQPGGMFAFDMPLVMRWLIEYYQPKGYTPGEMIWWTHIRDNPFFMAGWAGLLVTGLNMFPISQLDGGHIAYTLFGKMAHWIARAFLVGVIAFSVYQGIQVMWLMIVLLLFAGTDHPPTRDDTVPLGWFRTALGYASLSIPILCFPPHVLFIWE